jgi:ribosomal protein S18 acetylase RimI-like enzyme
VPDAVALARANFRVHASFPSRGIAGAILRESRALTWIDSGLDTDTFSIVLGARLDPDEVPGAAAEVITHFRSVGRPFSWWVCPGDAPEDLGARLIGAGLTPEEWELAMACPLDDFRRAPSVEGLVVGRARSPQDLAAFARINAENWAPPDPLVERYYARAAERLLAADSPLRFYLARRNGREVAAVEIASSPGALGVYNLSTRREHRNAGIGGALLSAAIDEAAKETGASRIVLQAAPAAAGLYRRLGFAEFGRIAEFKPAHNVR